MLCLDVNAGGCNRGTGSVSGFRWQVSRYSPSPTAFTNLRSASSVFGLSIGAWSNNRLLRISQYWRKSSQPTSDVKRVEYPDPTQDVTTSNPSNSQQCLETGPVLSVQQRR